MEKDILMGLGGTMLVVTGITNAIRKLYLHLNTLWLKHQ
jgi:hypothetical protein